MTKGHDSLRNEKAAVTCGRPGCSEPVPKRATGRPALYCSAACRVSAHRQRQQSRGPVTVEIDLGSASSRGRSPDRSWLVRLRRGEDSVIVTIGLSRPTAESLAEQLGELLS
jgi:hypothetical protein